jgi:molybdopterin converting factor subunit 1
MNKIRILLFATLRQQAGTKAIDLEVPDGTNVRAIKEQLGREFPALRDSMGTVLTAVNREFAFEDAVIPANGEVALFPPVSGG